MNQITERPPAVVTNVSDMSEKMRAALLAAREKDAGSFVLHSTTDARTAMALFRRGMIGSADYLTQAGLRARAALLELEAGRSARVVVTQQQQSPIADLYGAVRHAAPALTDVARYVAQLRRWASEEARTAWDEGRRDAFAMVAEQLEAHVLRDLAPVLMPEAVRRDAAVAVREV